ncbi:iron-siderophore ABC transporter substrate-binding protein [Hoyosella rhizosphaerae]|uniref:Iron ABC transporter substrate-binding protein n=1 Tax=Hoyosella rhizosphaerae TaxID=1755582 RepID=A0A916UC03_9ACTN|nr:iron-siderophore ABC transporter substrate-binding protein [Hoyosella rhizosphaerae]MBN4925868.1 iron-siderophore ABC transporter substrate-binding protein [Hoyosella rhizosphaerae]GGC67326.1 iron ABC transporter substrate-binding protein [Hoyosella rhizosphaerae]
MITTQSRRVLASAVVAAALLAGCASPDVEPTSPTATQGDFPRTVEHFRGATEIPAQPVRVAALDSSYSDAVLLLESELVAHTDYRQDGLPEYLGADRETFAAEAVSVGELSNPSLERLAAINPDVIISAEVRHGELYDQLSAIAPTVFSETTGPTWKDNIRLLAEALGKEVVADAKLAEYEERAQKIGAEINAKHNNPVVSIIRFAGEPTARLYRTTSFSGIVLEDAGIARPDSQLADPENPTNIMNAISPENLHLAEADLIIVSSYDPGDDKDAESVREAAQPFRASRLWDTLEGRKVDVRDEVWMMPVSVQGAHAILDNLAEIFDVDPHRN